MKKLAAITFTSMVLLLATAMVVGAVDTVEVRGKVATGSDTWTTDNFAGFYYDIDDGIGTEELTTVVTNGKLEEDDGVIYTTKPEEIEFEFEDWGKYSVIGFLAEKYFAGYIASDEENNILYSKSTDANSLDEEQLQKILMDDDDEITVTSGTPLKLKEGYELAIQSIDIDGNKVYVELHKDGDVVDSMVISPSKSDRPTMADKTYYYKRTVGDQKDLVTIGVHFKNAFRGSDQNLATVDGIWQISDTATSVKDDDEYGKMTIKLVNADGIEMRNEDNTITLSKNKDIELMEGIKIKTADQDEVNDENPLRYYIYKEITEPGTYEIRGEVAEITDGSTKMWNNENFAGFYYDIDDGIGKEMLTAVITNGKLEEDGGVRYITEPEEMEFEFEDWGKFNVIGFLAEKYFAGYVASDEENNILYSKSTDANSLEEEQLQKILMDDDDEITVTSGTPLKLEEGYDLAIQSIDIDGNKVYVELHKDGDVVDSMVISPSKSDRPTMADKTYYYKRNVGDQKDLVTIGVHFKNAFRGSDQNLATVDGVWQISDTATSVKDDDKYGKMTITEVNADGIKMENEDNTITLSKNKDIDLMEGIKIKTADQDEVDADNPLRYYIYKEVTIEGDAAPEKKVEPETAVAVAENKTVEAKEAVAVAENKTVEAKEAVAEAEAKKAAEAVADAEAEAKKAAEATNKTTSGFGSIFALTGLMAVAYLVLSRRD